MPKTQININKFLGLNEQGNTQLKIGEAETMTNWRLVDEYKPRVIEGYEQLFNSLGSLAIPFVWYGKITSSYNLVFEADNHIYRDFSISGTGFDTLVTSNTNVDVVKTTALNGANAGTTGIDDVVILKNSDGTQRTEVTQANVDLVASVGKFYYDTDEKINLIVAKGAYANIGAARTGLGSISGFYRIGTMASSTQRFHNVFLFDSKLYIQNGVKYYSWAGTGSIAEVTGYAPVIAISTPPAGGGTDYESLNLLTGSKRQWFSGDGATLNFFIAETAVDSIDWVKNRVTGATLTLTTDYTVDLTLGKVTFVVAPTNVANNIEIKWTKGSGTRTAIETCRDTLIYGGDNDTRAFMWGNTSNPNRRYFSALAEGVPSAEYFPAENYHDIGNNQSSISDIVKQYDRQIIFMDNGKSFYSYYNKLLLSDDSYAITFPIYPLNDAIGNDAFGQVQIIKNNPFVLQSGVYQFISTNVRDEKNAIKMSDRVQTTIASNLSSELLSNVYIRTYDYEQKSEYWIAFGSDILIYNYRLDVWYKFNIGTIISSFAIYDGSLVIGTDDGTIYRFDDSLRSFNGDNIEAQLYLGFMDAGQPNKIKNLEESHVAIKAESNSSIDVYWETNRKGEANITAISVGYTNLDFDDLDFDNLGFDGVLNPKTIRVKTRATEWNYYRPIFKVNSDYYTAQLLEYTFEPYINETSRR